MEEIVIHVKLDVQGARVAVDPIFPEPDVQPHVFGSENFAFMSPRERQVLEYLSAGMTNQEIANVLGISEKTVRTHLMNIAHIVGHHSGRRTIALAILTGVVSAKRIWEIWTNELGEQDARASVMD